MSNPNRHNTKRFADGGYTKDNPGGFTTGTYTRENKSLGGYRSQSDLVGPSGGYDRSQRGVREHLDIMKREREGNPEDYGVRRRYKSGGKV